MPHRHGSRGPLARLVDSLEFERALRARSRATTPHFAVHHVRVSPGAVSGSAASPADTELSTEPAGADERPVDECAGEPPRWLGAVVPKRHARRAVTRSLLKRQIYGVAERHRAQLMAGIWVVRLRAPFDRASFPSAASAALKACARGELETLFGAAVAQRSA